MSVVLRDAVSGGFGAFCCTYVGMPFDTIKVRMQTGSSELYPTTFSAVTRTVQCEGISALWKGSLPALTSALTENVVVFAANGVIRRTLAQSGLLPSAEEHCLGFWQEATVGGLSGLCSATAICPAEVIKCRLQVARGSNFGAIASVQSLWSQEGYRGFFRGLTALWSRDIPYYIVFFSVYTQCIDFLLKCHGEKEKEKLPIWNFALGGGIAGMCGWGVVFPLDVIKSRKQVGVLQQSKSTFEVAVNIARLEGFKAMRGWLPAVLRGFPANGALVLGVEISQRLLDSLSNAP